MLALLNVSTATTFVQSITMNDVKKKKKSFFIFKHSNYIILIIKLTLPKMETYEHCRYFKLQEFKKPVDLIKFEILLTFDGIYNILVFACEENFNASKLEPCNFQKQKICTRNQIIVWTRSGQMVIL